MSLIRKKNRRQLKTEKWTSKHR